MMENIPAWGMLGMVVVNAALSVGAFVGTSKANAKQHELQTGAYKSLAEKLSGVDEKVTELRARDPGTTQMITEAKREISELRETVVMQGKEIAETRGKSAARWEMLQQVLKLRSAATD